MIVKLAQAYPSIYGTPVIDKIDTAIFTERYFTHCFQCDFCFDSCCQHGVDVDLINLERMRARLRDLEVHLDSSYVDWFHSTLEACAECPGEGLARTKNAGNRCVFLNPSQRGCRVHSFCLAEQIDYHTLKPMICSLFPITFDNDLLRPADDVIDRTLICLGSGETLYTGVRSELEHYWGAEFVSELDQLYKVCK